MRLLELEPQFMRYEDRDDSHYTIPVNSLSEAQGIWFLCPKCFVQNKGNIGTHMVDVTFAGRGALDSQGSHGNDGKPTRWVVSGTDFSNLTLQPSVLLEGGCAWHGFVTQGNISSV